MDELRTTLRRALISEFGVKGALDDDTAIFSSGLIDSLSVMDLVGLVEQKINLDIPPTEITLENFDSINRIVCFVQRLRETGGAA